MSEITKIKVTVNGPLLVSGAVEYVDSDGAVIETLAKAALCRCGHSQSKPFCDGSHRTSGFIADTIKTKAK
jgi:CDGSH-type Zn-finger protein